MKQLPETGWENQFYPSSVSKTYSKIIQRFSPKAQPEHCKLFVVKGLQYTYTAAPLPP